MHLFIFVNSMDVKMSFSWNFHPNGSLNDFSRASLKLLNIYEIRTNILNTKFHHKTIAAAKLPGDYVKETIRVSKETTTLSPAIRLPLITNKTITERRHWKDFIPLGKCNSFKMQKFVFRKGSDTAFQDFPSLDGNAGALTEN